MPVTRGVAPIFIIADEDREASGRMVGSLTPDWYYIPVADPKFVVKYAKQFATVAILLADELPYPQGGTARLLQDLLDEVGKPVVILAELWDPGVAEKWKRMGAYDCIPHPTRTRERIKVLRGTLRKLALVEKEPLRRETDSKGDQGEIP